MASRMVGSAVALVLLTGCSTSSSFVISPTIETTPGVNVVQRANGNEVESIAFRREGFKVNDSGIRACLVQHIVPLSNVPGTDVLQPDVETYQRQGNADTRLGNMHYRVSLQTVGSDYYYLFDQLGWQRNTDANDKNAADNLTPIGAWQGDAYQVAYDTLVNISAQTQDCLSKTAATQPEPAAKAKSKSR